MIEIENVCHQIDGTPILRNVSLTLPARGVTALVGPNGAGKSSLLSVMARLWDLQSGRIAFDGLDIRTTPTQQLARKLAILRQDTAISTRLRVRDLVGFGRYPHHRGRPRQVDKQAVADAIDAFDLGNLANRFTDTLSGGQRQRAMIAMTYAQSADYLLLDEPLNSLDIGHARSLMERLRQLADQHSRAVVVVVHEVNYAAAHADHVVLMSGGTVAAVGPVRDVIRAEVLAPIFATPLEVRDIGGKPLVIHHGF